MQVILLRRDIMGTWFHVLIATAGIAVIYFTAKKIQELNDDYRYFNQDVQRYIDSK